MTSPKIDPEIAAMTTIASALQDLDPETQERVLRWSAEKYNVNLGFKKKAVIGSSSPSSESNGDQYESNSELSDLIEYSQEDGFEFHFRLLDLKASNKRDAVNRLVHVILYSHEMLTGEKGVQRSVISKILEDWRLNDGNARNFIGNHQGFKRKGKGNKLEMYLDRPGKTEAEKYISEIRDQELKGSWNPNKTSAKKKTKKKAKKS